MLQWIEENEHAVEFRAYKQYDLVFGEGKATK
jgi:hypothetical protein